MVQVFTSSVLDAPLEAVWALVRDFDALPDWHPGVVRSHIEDERPADAVGCVRNFDLADGGNIREQLLALSDVEHLCTYSILDSPMPVVNYTATLRLLPVTDGARTYIEWTASFDCPAAEEAGLVEGIGTGVFQGGFDGLKARLSG